MLEIIYFHLTHTFKNLSQVKLFNFFIASDSDPVILGFNQLFIVENNTKYPFLHAGAMIIDFEQPYRGYMLDWIKVITKYYSLTGYISIDFKIFSNNLEILDITDYLAAIDCIQENTKTLCLII